MGKLHCELFVYTIENEFLLHISFMLGKKDGQPMAYHVSAGVDSFTNVTLAQKEQWLGKGHEFVLIDTPGQLYCYFSWHKFVCVNKWTKPTHTVRIF